MCDYGSTYMVERIRNRPSVIGATRASGKGRNFIHFKHVQEM